MSMDVGFTKDNLVMLDSTYNPRDPDSFDYDAMINELLAHPGIQAVSTTGTPPPATGAYNPWRRPGWGENEFKPISHTVVGPEYMDVMQFRLLAGRWFSRDTPTSCRHSSHRRRDSRLRHRLRARIAPSLRAPLSRTSASNRQKPRSTRSSCPAGVRRRPASRSWTFVSSASLTTFASAAASRTRCARPA